MELLTPRGPMGIMPCKKCGCGGTVNKCFPHIRLSGKVMSIDNGCGCGHKTVVKVEEGEHPWEHTFIRAGMLYNIDYWL